jgi:hypothetical protein
MLVMRRAAVMLALAFSLVTSAGATTGSGLFGVVMRGPITPVCTADSPCDAPAAGVTLLFWRNGAVAGRVVTGRDGKYRIALRPGVYAVQGPKRMTPLGVRVVAGHFTRQNFGVDTGSR